MMYSREYNYTPCTQPTVKCFYVKILKVLSDYKLKTIDEIYKAIPGTEKRKYELFDGRIQHKWVNWGMLTALVKNGLVFRTHNNHYQLTYQGSEVLNKANVTA